MTTWTYNINSIVHGDTQTFCSIELMADGKTYQNFDFPLEEDIAGLNAEELKGIVTPYVKKITDSLDPVYEEDVTAEAVVSDIQDVIDKITEPITVN